MYIIMCMHVCLYMSVRVCMYVCINVAVAAVVVAAVVAAVAVAAAVVAAVVRPHKTAVRGSQDSPRVWGQLGRFSRSLRTLVVRLWAQLL